MNTQPRTRACLLAIALALAACKTGTAGTGVKPVKVTAVPTPSLAIASAAPAKLAASTTPTTRFAGQVLVDGAYALASGAGRALAGGVVALGDAGLIANNSSNLIVPGDAGLLSEAGGGLLSDAGAGLLSDAGAGIISDHGGALVANNGSSLIGKTKFHLAGAEAAGPVPAAGMRLVVLDMREGKALPLGVGPDGKPAYVIATNTDGRYELYLPQALAPNLRVVALAAGNDPRLALSLVTPASAAPPALDDDHSLATRYMRGCLLAYLQDQAGRQTGAPPSPSTSNTPFLPAVTLVFTSEQLANMGKLRGAHARHVVQAFADAVLAVVDLAALVTSPQDNHWTGPPEPALPVIEQQLHALAAATAQRLATDPHFFDQRPFFVDANRHRAAQGLPPYALARPADLGALVFNDYMDTTNKRQQEKLRYVYADLGLPIAEYEHLRAAYSGVFAGLAGALLSNTEAQDAAKHVLATVLPAELARQQAETSTPAASPTAPPAPPATTVTTLAGDGTAGFADGPAARARFHDPTGLVVAGDRLVIADTTNHRLRQLDLTDPAHPVTTLAGTGEAGGTDGPAAQATLASPRGLAYDAAANVLYVAELTGARIRRVTLGATPTVTTLAGAADGSAGFADGPGAAARFDTPSGLALDGRGHLYVADMNNHRVRAIDLAEAQHAVTTVAGDSPIEGAAAERRTGPTELGVGNPLGPSALAFPTALAVEPSGRLLIADHYYMLGLQANTLAVLAGNGWGGPTDGFWTNAQFSYPGALALDARGGVLVAEEIDERIRRASADGADALVVETLAGGGDQAHGYADGPGATARFNKPAGIAVDARGTIYVADTQNQRLRAMISP